MVGGYRDYRYCGPEGSSLIFEGGVGVPLEFVFKKCISWAADLCVYAQLLRMHHRMTRKVLLALLRRFVSETDKNHQYHIMGSFCAPCGKRDIERVSVY
jgi:hypothetical protein